LAKTFQPIRKVEQERKKESPFAASMRNRKKTGVRWNDTNPEWLRYAAAACTQNNATLVLAPAMGGIGVTIRVWKGEDKWVEYANSPEEFDGWMEAIRMVLRGHRMAQEKKLDARRYIEVWRDVQTLFLTVWLLTRVCILRQGRKSISVCRSFDCRRAHDHVPVSHSYDGL
jgi:hypothetical protein